MAKRNQISATVDDETLFRSFDGGFVTSVVRSGRLSGKGAFNAAAKELAKKIATLRGVK